MTDLLRFFPTEDPEFPRPRVLWTTNMWPDETRPYYGNFIKSQAESLRRVGLSVDVLYLRGLVGRRAYLATFPELRRRVRDLRYDLVHAHYGHTAAVTAASLRRPLILSFCGEDLLGAPRPGGADTRKSRAEVAVFRQLPRLAAATITKSSEMELALPRSLRAKNRVLPNGVDLDLFRKRPRRGARLEVGWDPDAKVAMFLGDPADPRKRVELAEEAMARVAERVPGARLEIVFGKDPEEMPTYMNAADCLVFTSRSEGSPNAVKEAMAAELPIVATPVGDVADRFADVEGCVVCPPDPEAFADALVDALAMGRAPAAREAVAALGMDRVALRLRELYEEVAKSATASS